MRVALIPVCFVTLLCLSAMACQSKSTSSQNGSQNSQSADRNAKPDETRDVHSYSNPEQIRVRHVDLDLEVLFDRRALKGTSTLTLERVASGDYPLKLDTRDLRIIKAEASTDGTNFTPTSFALGDADKILGAPLTVQLPPQATKVRIEYESTPGASGVQWLEPAQTAGKKQPYMFTQSEAIHARSWIPLQDSPRVRVTYSARIRTPKELRAVMSAEQDANAPRNGDYRFNMPQAIPPYLIALAVGDLAFKPLGPRTGVYTEPSMLEKAARELADTEKMVEATEKLYGPYRWGRYDILVLPPSFPIGGMENPRLTFATPTILAGDKSLVSLVAHELAHSWSGNLVTNATWRDFWLNEGFTVYLERRIVEAVYGRPREEMEAVLGRQTLEKELADNKPDDQILHIDLTGRDPDEGFTEIPYEKGALFLRHLEETFGREKFDQFLKGYFDHFAFQSITTADFREYLQKNLLDPNPQLAAKVPVDEWVSKPGLPASAPRPVSDAFAKVEEQAKGWLEGKTPAAKLQTRGWSTQEWLHFLKFLPPQLNQTQMQELDRAFNLTKVGNAEIAHVWLLMAIRNKYEAAYPRLEEYLISIGRQKLIKPLYEELVKTPEGRERALQIYRKARPGYHPIAQGSVDKIVKWEKA
ncbi:MAG TPA: M1 family metallopeptidase [Blastocatellia bacterium]|nr:M1 family metallopeptidase [Blastocatellia bacterium]